VYFCYTCPKTSNQTLVRKNVLNEKGYDVQNIILRCRVYCLGLVRLFPIHMDWMRLEKILKKFDLFGIQIHPIPLNSHGLRANRTSPYRVKFEIGSEIKGRIGRLLEIEIPCTDIGKKNILKGRLQ
jgi:hypothetical protein